MPKKEINACQSEACALQTCLNKYTYTPERCHINMRKLYQCCQQFYQTQSTQDKAESTACPLPHVVNRWLDEHGSS
ncbi:hypothetical protein FA15DRAFT_617920 [Coprinopsis marcescibilis]|uniref:Cx9C motif-containing protein 4, mitochondrial n=1 Tax=Coprinopsis marcescibilis TaxID=230819 RepID=A0A5C3LAT6_COPMA|nr:hypothetical protein FA15DRAFT_617920 [Coprinopsis marcescibilis]